MRFFFDNDLSFRIAHALGQLAESEGDEVVALRDKFPQSATDVDWISILSADQEPRWIVITADRGIGRKPCEIKAWKETGLTICFLERGWMKMRFWDQAWHLIKHWPAIREYSDKAVDGSGFRVGVSGRIRQV